MPQSSITEKLKNIFTIDDDYVMQYASYTIITVTIVQFVLSRESALTMPKFTTTLILLGLLLALNASWGPLSDAFGSESIGDWLFILASTVLMSAAFAVGEPALYPYLLFMIVAQSFATKSFIPASAITLANLALFYGILYAKYDESLAQLLFTTGSGFLFGIVFVITLTMALRYTSEQRDRVEDLANELQKTNVELRAAQERERELAAAAERVRLARDIHDGLGHYLTVLNVQLQVAQKLMKQKNTDKAEDVIVICRQQAQDALKEVRRSVAVMRQTPLDGTTLDNAIKKLTQEFDEYSPLAAEFSLRGTPITLPQHMALTLYRVAQEGLTNAQKHGRGSQHVYITLAYEEECTRITVSNDGKQIEPNTLHSKEGRFGLAGLQERADQLGGEFTAHPRVEGGFQIVMTIPKEALHD